MTSTKELRQALQNVEPAFSGIDIAVVRHRARRVRRRRRVAGAALSCAVLAGGVAALPHLAPRVPGGAAQNAMPGAGETPGWLLHGGAEPLAAGRLMKAKLHARGVLPAVTRTGALVDLGEVPGKAWLRPPLTGEAEPRFCVGSDPAEVSASDCDPMVTNPSGFVAQRGIVSDDDSRLAILVVPAKVRTARAVDSIGETRASVYDLGQGYSLVVARPRPQPPSPQPITEVIAAFDENGDMVAREVHQESAEARVSDEAAAKINRYLAPLPKLTASGPRVDDGSGQDMWLEPAAPGETTPMFCAAARGKQPAYPCRALPGAGSSQLLQFSSRSDTLANGRLMWVRTVITHAPIDRVAAVEGDRTVEGTVTDMSGGYRALTVKLEVLPGVSYRVELRGFDTAGKELVRSASVFTMH